MSSYTMNAKDRRPMDRTSLLSSCVKKGLPMTPCKDQCRPLNTCADMTREQSITNTQSECGYGEC